MCPVLFPAALVTFFFAFTVAQNVHRKDARDQRHRVGHIHRNPVGESYAGFIDIRHWDAGNGVQGNASMFYWFFPALNATHPDPPLIIWFQGGPGSSSMIGLFYEMGPVHINENLDLTWNPDSWANDYSMVFIDQPVGVGYSYVEPLVPVVVPNEHPTSQLSQFQADPSNMKPNTGDSSSGLWGEYFGQKPIVKDDARTRRSEDSDYSHGYVINQRGVTKDLLTFLDGFYEKYPDQAERELYVMGESYAGKFVPSFASAIHQRNILAHEDDPSSPRFIPLAGIAIGNGLTDPITQLKMHGVQWYHLGVIDLQQAQEIDKLADLAVEQIKAGNFAQATGTRLALFGLFKDYTGGINWYDARKGDCLNNYTLMNESLNLERFKVALHVQDDGRIRFFGKDMAVPAFLREDITRSTAHLFPLLLSNYRVLLYQGQFDFRDGVTSNVPWVDALDWPGREGLAAAPRMPWRSVDPVDGKRHVAGWVQSYANLTRVSLFGAGHLSAMDQPANTREMISNFIEKRPWIPESDVVS